MEDKEFKECWFINDEMKFYSYKDFVKNSVVIKKLYKNNLGKYGKTFYKWFLYANIHITINQKNTIWNYLNDYCDKIELYSNTK